MKRRILCFILLFSLLLPMAGALTLEDFTDVEGHWAAAYLEKAVVDGLYQGDQGKLRPNDPVKGGELAAILTRLLEAETQDAPYPGAAEDAWFYESAAKALALGILPGDGAWNLEKPLTRAQVAVAMAAAFQTERAEEDFSELQAFSDCGDLSRGEKRAASSLVRAKVLQGSGGKLRLRDSITRAEFAAMVYRVVAGKSGVTEDFTGEESLLYTAPNTVLEDTTLTGGALFAAPVRNLQLKRVQAGGNLVVRSSGMDALTVSEVRAPRLVLAQTGGALGLAVDGESQIETLAVGQGTGAVTLSGYAGTVEVTGDNRTLYLKNCALQALLVSGSGNTVVVESGSSVETVTVLQGALDNQIQVDGTVQTAALKGIGTSLTGSGGAALVQITAKNCVVSLESGETQDLVDRGLSEITLVLSAPDKISAGGKLTATVAITGVTGEKVCAAQWTRDGKAVPNFGNANFLLQEGKTSSLSQPIEFKKDMALKVTVGFTLTYENPSSGETETVSVDKVVAIENYPDSYYDSRDVNAVLKKVSDVYKGNYTSSYNIDYETFEKEIFVNHKKYSSKSKYLVWISKATQKVNIFTGSQGNWKLDRTFRCATGAPATPTPSGVTYITGKQPGWYLKNYTCRYIVRFYPGTGYAFHTRLYYPNSNKLKAPSMGFPVSAGCIRMMDPDIKWIYDEVPVGTTVVVY